MLHPSSLHTSSPLLPYTTPLLPTYLQSPPPTLHPSSLRTSSPFLPYTTPLLPTYLQSPPPLHYTPPPYVPPVPSSPTLHPSSLRTSSPFLPYTTPLLPTTKSLCRGWSGDCKGGGGGIKEPFRPGRTHNSVGGTEGWSKGSLVLTIRPYQLRPTLCTDTHTRDVVKYVMCAYSFISVCVVFSYCRWTLKLKGTFRVILQYKWYLLCPE